jgi:hypothetical protein
MLEMNDVTLNRRALGIRGAGYVESGAWVESGSL